MEASIRSAFGPWSPAPGQPPAPPRAASGAGGGSGAPGGGGEGVVWLVDRPGAAQVAARARGRGENRQTPWNAAAPPCARAARPVPAARRAPC